MNCIGFAYNSSLIGDGRHVSPPSYVPGQSLPPLALFHRHGIVQIPFCNC